MIPDGRGPRDEVSISIDLPATVAEEAYPTFESPDRNGRVKGPIRSEHLGAGPPRIRRGETGHQHTGEEQD